MCVSLFFSAASQVSDSSSRNLDADGILGLVRSSVQPDIERRLEERRRLDAMAVRHILTARVVAAPAGGGGDGQDEDDEEEEAGGRRD